MFIIYNIMPKLVNIIVLHKIHSQCKYNNYNVFKISNHKENK